MEILFDREEFLMLALLFVFVIVFACIGIPAALLSLLPKGSENE